MAFDKIETRPLKAGFRKNADGEKEDVFHDVMYLLINDGLGGRMQQVGWIGVEDNSHIHLIRRLPDCELRKLHDLVQTELGPREFPGQPPMLDEEEADEQEEDEADDDDDA